MFKSRKSLLLGVLAFTAMFVGSVANAATSVSWLSPADGSTYTTGTMVSPTGQASGVGGTGGTGLDLVLVIDVSGSMGWSGNAGLDAAKAAANALVGSLMPIAALTSVGIVQFNSSATSNVPLGLTPVSTGMSAITAAINGLTAYGGTNIGAGVSAGATTLTGGQTPGRMMLQVLISDGLSATYNSEAATAYNNSGIITHTVGVPGHNAAQMQLVATDGHGVYTNVTSLTDLTSLFDGTGGNLVGLQSVDVTMPDGTLLTNVATNGLGHFFSVGPYALATGANVFTAFATGDDQTTATATLTLYGQDGTTTVPEPGSLALLGLGLLAMVRVRAKARRQ